MGRVAWSLVFCMLAVVPIIAPAPPLPVTPIPAALNVPRAPAPIAKPLRPKRRARVRSLAAAAPIAPSHSAARALDTSAIVTEPLLPVIRPAASPAALLQNVTTIVPAAPRPARFIPQRPRPSALVPMYASFATLQALDYHSTTRALASGAGREANPFARSLVRSRPAFVAAKVGATVVIVMAAEKIWKKHPVRAVIFMAAANTAVGAVVAHNYSVRQR